MTSVTQLSPPRKYEHTPHFGHTNCNHTNVKQHTDRHPTLDLNTEK